MHICIVLCFACCLLSNQINLILHKGCNDMNSIMVYNNTYIAAYKSDDGIYVYTCGSTRQQHLVALYSLSTKTVMFSNCNLIEDPSIYNKEHDSYEMISRLYGSPLCDAGSGLYRPCYLCYDGHIVIFTVMDGKIVHTQVIDLYSSEQAVNAGSFPFSVFPLT